MFKRSDATAHGTPEGVLHVSKFARAINISLLQSEERIRLSLGTLSLFWARTIMIWLRLCRAVLPLRSLWLCGDGFLRTLLTSEAQRTQGRTEEAKYPYQVFLVMNIHSGLE